MAQENTAEVLAFRKVLVRNVALPLVVSATICAIFVYLLAGLISLSREVEESDLIISKANQIWRLIVDAETGDRGFMLTGQEQFLDPYRIALSQTDPLFAEIKSLAAARPDQVRRMDSARAQFANWRAWVEEKHARKRAGTYKSGEEAAYGKLEMDKIRSVFNDFLLSAERLRNDRNKSSRESTRTTVLFTVIISIVSGALIAWFGRRQLMQLSEDFGKALNAQREQNRILEEQAWKRKGHADLSDRIRGDLTAPEISERALSFLGEFARSVMSAVYIVNDLGKLELAAASAMPSEGRLGKDQLQASYDLREGLIGQSAVDKKLVILTQLPDNYVPITSALGGTQPKHLALLPLTADGVIAGVMELAYLDPIPDRTREFLAEIQELLGVALRSAAYRGRLRQFLQEAQQLNEELQAQQEELRVSNEELSERTQALQEVQARLEGQQAELEQTNSQLEEQAQQLEVQKQGLDEKNRSLQVAHLAVEEKARELEAASRYKSEFLANMSHELRTPLNSSLILAKLLKDNPDGNLKPEQVEFAQTIYDAGNDLLNLINDILDLSKVEAGKLEISPIRVSMDSLMESLSRTFTPMAKDKGLELEVMLDPSAPKTIESDRLRVEQVLKNLLSNAIKFTSTGKVFIKVSSEDRVHVRFAVTDTGIGIAPEQHQVIFEAFRQADGTTNRKYGGTGLGLSISKNLAHLLGGEIEVESHKGEGSTFTLVLPIEFNLVAPSGPANLPSPAAATSQADGLAVSERVRPNRAGSASITAPVFPPQRQPRAAPFKDDRDKIEPGKDRSVLLIEDEVHYAKILFDLAHKHGFKVIASDNTTDGFALALEYMPSAVILDMKLPDALGLSLLDRLKENPKTRHIPVHAMSVSDYSREALHMGAVGFFNKDGNREDIEKIFQKIEGKLSQKIKRVLIVEDDEVQRASVAKLLHGLGAETYTAATAQDALNQLRETTYDCMVMDLVLPDMSGLELLAQLANGDQYAFPPVIVYTGRSLSREEEDKLRRYSKSIIIKSARSPERLLDEVTLFLHQMESKLPANHQKLIQASRNREKAFDGRRILLVDDDVRNIFALTSALEYRGANVKIARNGREALARLEEEGQVDLVLMDIMMPEMDGYQAMRAIRANPKNADLPIIAVTAKAMKDDYERALREGANDYLAKPIDIEKLVSLMRVWISQRHGGI